tara:strand:- start:343 stop:1086 length:744 start_codon:yes stop_codon:yes gene_type:complete
MSLLYEVKVELANSVPEHVRIWNNVASKLENLVGISIPNLPHHPREAQDRIKTLKTALKKLDQNDANGSRPIPLSGLLDLHTEVIPDLRVDPAYYTQSLQFRFFCSDPGDYNLYDAPILLATQPCPELSVCKSTTKIYKNAEFEVWTETTTSSGVQYDDFIRNLDQIDGVELLCGESEKITNVVNLSGKKKLDKVIANYAFSGSPKAITQVHATLLTSFPLASNNGISIGAIKYIVLLTPQNTSTIE